MVEFQTKRGPFLPEAGNGFHRMMQTKQVTHVADATTETHPGVAARLGGARSMAHVPMLKDDELVGAILIYRQEILPFTDKQIALVKNFAAQAVIAVENTRLLNELRQRTDDLTEALEQQTATSEVLKVISSSPGELDPVFDAMLANAVRICEAKFGNLFLYDGEAFRIVALHGAPPAFADERRRNPVIRPRPGTSHARIVETRQPDQVLDAQAEPAYRNDPVRRVGFLELAGARTFINVPMLKENELVGTITIYRQEVRPFTDKQIELMQNFAAQAVIAIENTRLLSELRESLQQQTATSEVLQVISSSTGELKPVFNAVLENAIHLCEAKFGVLYRYDGNLFHPEALVGASQALIEFHQKRGAFQAVPGTPLHQLWQTRDVVHTADDAGGPSSSARLGGARSHLAVPMFKEAALVGSIIIYRQEVRPFTDKQIALVQNFAAQAVIAIENTRLFNELRQRTDDLTESLEQQTATSEVLKVISSSPGDLEPVFQAMLANATRICEAKFGTVFRFDGQRFHLAAGTDLPPEFAEFQRKRGAFQPEAGTQLDTVLRTKATSYSADRLAEGAPGPSVRLGGARSQVAVPMLKDHELVGAFLIYRQEVRPFTDKQIELVSNFAAQAVIAIENARLLNELRESLQQQTATSDVLSVISSSPGELVPVFNAMLENALRICDAKFGMLFQRHSGNSFVVQVMVGAPPELVDALLHKPMTPRPGVPLDRVMRTKKLVHTVDAAAEQTKPLSAQLAGARSHITVPMLKDNEVAGAISIYRQEVKPFTDKQIELLTNFAAQAVRHREHAAAQRTAPAHRRSDRVAGATDRDQRGAASHLSLTRRAGARVPGHARECGAHL